MRGYCYEAKEADKDQDSLSISGSIRTNNAIERLNREIRRRIRLVGCFPDGSSALVPVCARLRRAVSSS